MAQDATGTPTSLGLPRYNTAADAPSGKGFNAAMDAIDALIVLRGLPGTPVTNGPVYWNGSAWVSAKLTDAQLDMTTIIPPGFVGHTAAAAAPTGWVLCDGAAISRTSFAALFTAIGTQYGVGDGATTFNVPNAKGKVLVGIDAAQAEFDVRGETGGEKTHVTTVPEMPAHTHPPAAGSDQFWTHGIAGAAQMASTNPNENLTYAAATGSTGGGLAHNNLQPYISLHTIIKL